MQSLIAEVETNYAAYTRMVLARGEDLMESHTALVEVLVTQSKQALQEHDVEVLIENQEPMQQLLDDLKGIIGDIFSKWQGGDDDWTDVFGGEFPTIQDTVDDSADDGIDDADDSLADDSVGDEIKTDDICHKTCCTVHLVAWRKIRFPLHPH